MYIRLTSLLIVYFYSVYGQYFDKENKNIQCSAIQNVKRKEFHIIQYANYFIPLISICPCDLKCNWYGFDKLNERIYDAMYVFQVTNAFISDIKTKQFPNQPIGIMELEPYEQSQYGGKNNFEYFTNNSDPDYKGYTWKSTYEADSDVRISYSVDYSIGFNLYPNQTKSDKYFAVFIVSNCVPKERLEYYKELSEYIHIMSIGKCMNTINDNKGDIIFPQCHKNKDPDDWLEHKKCYVSKFKFYLAFENYRHDDYITEKYFASFDVDTIPVYMGAPNIRKYEPGKFSAIYTDDFPSVKHLAEYMKIVASDKNLYNSYFEWKKKPLNPEFVKLYYQNYEYFSCNVCYKLATYYNKN
jgi:hypothetical protein